MPMLTPSIIARESLMILRNNTVAASLVYRDDTANFVGARVGDTVTIRKPASFEVHEFTSTITTQGVNEGSVPIKLEKHFDISVELTTKQTTLELNDFSVQVITPAMVNMAERLDAYLYSKYVEIYDVNGDGNLNAISDLADLDRALMVKQVPITGRIGFLSPLTKSRFLSIENLHRQDVRGAEGLAALRDASLGRAMGIDWYGAHAVPSHTAGAPGGTPTGTGTAGETTVAVASGGNAGTFKKGDIVTFAGHTQTYAVQADATLSGSGAGTITVSPALAQNVSAAAITVKASHAANIVGHPRGLSLVTVPLELPMDGSKAAYIGGFAGFNIRVVYGYDINSKKNIISFDTLVGAKVTDPRLLVRYDG